jgi:dTDP-D-glucose 4,6-dehydratase
MSTDEVYRSLLPDEPRFLEINAYQPNNAYSA